MSRSAKKNKQTNPHCPVDGCRASKPHADDPIVKALMFQFAPPEQMTFWTLSAMAELASSICRDLNEGKVFAWLSRIRQPEELYIRTLYALFVASDAELPHILSGAMPNGLSNLYSKVNEVVFNGKGQLLVQQPGQSFGAFRAMDTLHDGAHASFRAFLTCIGLVRNPEGLPAVDKYTKHLKTYCTYLNHMHEMFKAGRRKEDVLVAVKNLHRPMSDWIRQKA